MLYEGVANKGQQKSKRKTHKNKKTTTIRTTPQNTKDITPESNKYNNKQKQ